MARNKRNWHPTGFYHVVMRGNNRQNIFIDAVDMREYSRVLDYVYARYPFEVHAYCIMTNHVHLLIRSPEVHLGTLMRHINKRYSDYYRKRHDYVGQIYENRYYSREVASTYNILDVSAYIHLNPIRTEIPMVKQLEKYPFSSYPYYYNRKINLQPYLRLDILPTFLPVENKTKEIYAQWCLEQKEEERFKNESVATNVQQLYKKGFA